MSNDSFSNGFGGLFGNSPDYQENSCNNREIQECKTDTTLSTEVQNCCCKKSMVEAMKLLCNTELSDIIDFEKFAFLSKQFTVGARLVLLKIGSEEKDNLSNLDGTFKRFAPCNCDLIDISGTAYYNVPLPFSLGDLAEVLTDLIKNIIDILGTQTGILGTLVDILKELLKLFDPLDFSEEILQAILDFLVKYFTVLPVVDSASLCTLDAIAFQVKRVDAPTSSEKTGDELTEANYRRAKCIFQKQLDNPCGCSECSGCKEHCDCDSCCCNSSILNELFTSNLSKKATLTAGNLTLREASVLGVKGNVIVLANDKRRRFYFICSNSVEFLE